MKLSALKCLAIFLFLFVASCTSTPINPPNPPMISIVEIAPSAETRATKSALIKILGKYDLSPYLFTKNIQIQSYGVPHAHPILTLNTELSNQPDFLLSALLHGEIQWFLDDHKSSVSKAMATFRHTYPLLSEESSVASGDSASPDSRLVVAYLELQALKYYLGNERAYTVIHAMDHDVSIYSLVLKDEKKISQVLTQYGIAHI